MSQPWGTIVTAADLWNGCANFDVCECTETLVLYYTPFLTFPSATFGHFHDLSAGLKIPASYEQELIISDVTF